MGLMTVNVECREPRPIQHWMLQCWHNFTQIFLTVIYNNALSKIKELTMQQLSVFLQTHKAYLCRVRERNECTTGTYYRGHKSTSANQRPHFIVLNMKKKICTDDPKVVQSLGLEYCSIKVSIKQQT